MINLQIIEPDYCDKLSMKRQTVEFYYDHCENGVDDFIERILLHSILFRLVFL